ncbi:hypothetical protein C8Q74DRAFT_498496 [Fomes fomentarius]|nr:hypothetical protein C8Q74DRAFT_498496 [Fomes fomentarius]
MPALQSFGRSALRITKNYSKGYSATQIKIRNATCNDPWPPSGKEMYELAQMTYNQGDFVEIMEVIDKRLNDKGKNWRHVFKSLVVLDYLLHSGSENVILYCRENLYEIKTLREFQYIDDDGHDQGVNVRHKAADVVNLLSDMGRLFEERKVRSNMHDRMIGRNSADTDPGLEEPRPYRARKRPLPNGLNRVADQEDEELQRAIEESKRSAAQEPHTAEDEDLAKAIKLSEEEEEEKRRKRMVESNATALFTDSNQFPPSVIQTQPLADASLPLQYATTGVQPQIPAMQPQFTSIQPQFTSYNPYLQQMQQEAMQAEYLRQQAEFTRRQELQAQQTAAQAASFQQQHFQQQSVPHSQPIVPQATGFGSNNPFAPHPAVSASPSSSASLSLPLRPSSRPTRDGTVRFNLPGTFEGRSPDRRDSYAERERVEERDSRGKDDAAFLRPFSTGTEPPRRFGSEREDARLAALFANYTGDGVDTFGNMGPLRCVFLLFYSFFSVFRACARARSFIGLVWY